MNKREIKQTIQELTDALYESHYLFRDYYDSLTQEQEDEIEKVLENILERRYPSLPKKQTKRNNDK